MRVLRNESNFGGSRHKEEVLPAGCLRRAALLTYAHPGS